MRIEEGFRQTPFVEENPYESDLVLPSLLQRLLPPSAFTDVEQDLVRLSNRILGEISDACDKATPPTLTQFDQWGRRVDTLHTSEGWRKLKDISQEEGIIGIFYERKYGEHSRLYGFAKQMLMYGHSQVIFCPLSMTDGCARVIELIGTPELRKDLYPRLISRDPSFAYTSGQWMTETTGGSDVSQTETIATPSPSAVDPSRPGSLYSLNGFKWFTSATDGDVALALARTGPASKGSRSLSLFVVPLGLPLIRQKGEVRSSSTTNNIAVHRLKNKLGTKIVPTAELELANSEAILLSPLNGGVKAITPVLNITRVHSAISSVGGLRRALSIARSFATVRKIKGSQVPLSSVPIHVAELAKASLIYRALTHFLFGTIHLLGKSECGTSTLDEENRLRLLTPVVKAFCAEKGCAALEECMTALGGQGYMEENAIGRLINDCLVEKIWEGTIVVLSLDLVRAIGSDQKCLKSYIKWGDDLLDSCPASLQSQLSSSLAGLQEHLHSLPKIYAQPIPELVPRPALVLVGYITCALHLLEQAIWSHQTSNDNQEVDKEVFVRWVDEVGLDAAAAEVQRLMNPKRGRVEANTSITFGIAKL